MATHAGRDEGGATSVSIRQGSTYLACSNEAHTGGVCEPGASATDGLATMGDLTSRVSCMHIHGAPHLPCLVPSV